MMSSTIAAHGDASMMQKKQGLLFGIGVSVSVHIVLLLAYRSTGPLPPAAEPESPSSITVRIAALPQPEPPRLAPAPRRRPKAAARSARQAPPQAVIAVPASPRQEAAADPFVVEQSDETATPAPGGTPQFSMSAARETARQLAGQTKLGREGTAHAQFPDPPLETESKAAKAIARAKRRDCKDGIPGGLLAPLYLMMDKKDHGCKW